MVFDKNYNATHFFMRIITISKACKVENGIMKNRATCQCQWLYSMLSTISHLISYYYSHLPPRQISRRSPARQA
jgi:hypothetical protein